MALFLRSIGIRDYSVREGTQSVGRIRFANERTPGIWLWHIQVHIPGGLPIGSAQDLNTAKAEFKAAWVEFKAKHGQEALEQAYWEMNARDRL